MHISQIVTDSTILLIEVSCSLFEGTCSSGPYLIQIIYSVVHLSKRMMTPFGEPSFLDLSPWVPYCCTMPYPRNPELRLLGFKGGVLRLDLLRYWGFQEGQGPPSQAFWGIKGTWSSPSQIKPRSCGWLAKSGSSVSGKFLNGSEGSRGPGRAGPGSRASVASVSGNLRDQGCRLPSDTRKSALVKRYWRS